MNKKLKNVCYAKEEYKDEEDISNGICGLARKTLQITLVLACIYIIQIESP